MRPEYILFHYPKPVLLDDRVDWAIWRFADSSEFVYESGYSMEEFMERSEELFDWLTNIGKEYEFTPVLEFDALNRYIYQNDCLAQMLERYRRVKLCLDTGRLYLQDRLDAFFDARQVIRKYAKYAELIHLWTLKYTGIIEHYHYPVLPELKPEEGWAPIGDYLQIIWEEKPQVKVLFEHRSDLISEDDLDRCYKWVEYILHGKKCSLS